MKKTWATLSFVGLTTLVVGAQPPPIEGRFVSIGYDAIAQNNGLNFVLEATNVILDMDHGRWEADLIQRGYRGSHHTLAPRVFHRSGGLLSRDCVARSRS